jgi:hypothetical protein
MKSQLKDMESDKKSDAVLAAVNPLLGCGIFVFLKTPNFWSVLKSPEPPECNALGKEEVKGGFRWIMSGFMHALLLNEEKQLAYPLFVEAKEFRNDSQPLGFIKTRLHKLEEKNRIVERKQLLVNGHEAVCSMWMSRKRMVLRRKEAILVNLECVTYCSFTRRLLLFRIQSSHIKGFMEDLEKILSILSSATCHA